MRFNELEFQTWILLTFLLLNFESHAIVSTLQQLLIVCAIYIKAFMLCDSNEPCATALPEEVS